MIQVRRNTFETNSSSTHSITLTTKDLYQQWKKGDLYLDGNCKIRPLSEILQAFKDSKSKWDNDKANEIENALKENDDVALAEVLTDHFIYSYDAYIDMVDESYEAFTESFTTPNGEEVIAFGYYGNEY